MRNVFIGFLTSSDKNYTLCSHRNRLEVCNFKHEKQRNCTIHDAKTNALISYAVFAQILLHRYCASLFQCK